MKVESLFDDSLEPEMIAWLRSQGDAITALNNVEQLFTKLKGQTVLGEVDEFVSIKGPAHIGKGSRIHSHVEIDGPVIIGENVSIRAQAQIRNFAYLGSDCIVGHSADIKRSICLNGSKIQDGTFVGDSVLGMSARVGSGAILANRKFNQGKIQYLDEEGKLVPSDREFLGTVLGKYARLGANVVLSPGTIVGEHTWVGSGCILHGRYPADMLITAKQELNVNPKDRVILRSGRGEYEYI